MSINLNGRIAGMKKTLAVTSLVAGVCTIVSLKNTVHAQDLQENEAAAHSVRNGKRGQRASSNSSPVPFNDATDSSIVSKVQRGLDAAPVPLNLSGKDIGLVGLGSYLVNIQMGCNGCHSAGPATEWAAGGNPYFGQPKVTNPVTYLGGGRDFGALIPGSASIVSRNL